MHRPSRLMGALLIATSMAALIAAPVTAAKPKPDKPAPPFTVTLNDSSIVDTGTEYLALTFTSTSPKREHGFARFELPTRLYPNSVFTVGFWGHILQTTQPLEPGYFRIEATSCGDAVLSAFSNGVIDQSYGYTTNPSIEVEFNCAAGQAFVIHWFVDGVNHALDRTLYDVWPLPVASRSNANRPWTPQTGPTLLVNGHFITLPPLPYITPPVQVVAMEPIVTTPEEPPTQWLLTGDAIFLDQHVTSEITINRIFRADTGEELVLVDPYDFRVNQTNIQVTSCIDLPGIIIPEVDLPPGVTPYDFSGDCSAMPDVLKIMPNPGSVANADGTLLSSQIAVIVGVLDFLTAPSQWKAAESRCLFRGGVYHEHTNVDELWTCTLPAPASNNDRYFFVAQDLGQTAYCPTGKIRNDPTLVERQIIACIP